MTMRRAQIAARRDRRGAGADDLGPARQGVNAFLTPAEAAAEAATSMPPGTAGDRRLCRQSRRRRLWRCDRAAGGASGGRRRERRFAPMIDPEAAAILHRHKVGDTVTLDSGRQVRPGLRRRPAAADGDGRPPVGRHLYRRRPDPGRHHPQLRPDRGVPGAGDRHPGRHPARADAGPAAGPRLRHRAEPPAVSGGQVDAAFPRRLRAGGGQGHRLRLRRAGHPQAHLRPYTRVRRPVWPLDTA
jgi:hypothetical protein